MSYGSRKGKFIYIRVPRTGSTTFLNYLKEGYPDLEQRGHHHGSAKDTMELWPDWDKRHTMGFIRNPWEWLVSFYNSGISVSGSAEIREKWAGDRITVGDREPPPGTEPNERMNFNFTDWVMQRQTTPCDWLMDSGQLLIKEVKRYEDVAPTLPLVFSAVPHEPYQEWYDVGLRDFVARKCAREIEMGEYEF